MALTIKQHDNQFLVEGIINASTVKQFKNHIEFLILYTKQLTINIEGVKTIDSNGVNTLKALVFFASKFNKKFKIVGYGCKDIYEELNYNKAA